jgi:hypothetical protein
MDIGLVWEYAKARAYEGYEPSTRWEVGYPKIGKLVRDPNVSYFRIDCWGVTRDEPPRGYRVWGWVHPLSLRKMETSAQVGYLGGKVISLVMSLETFLDPRCECKLGEDGGLGPYCAWHEERMGKRE